MKKQPNDNFSRLNKLIWLFIAYVLQILSSVRSHITKGYSALININDPIVRLMRLDKPAPLLLLVLPIWWIIGLAASNPISILFFCLFFFMGAVFMRGAGCIINDIFDRDLDSKVERTKNRPLANKELPVKQALQIMLALLLFAAILLFMLPKSAIYIGVFALVPIAIYPLMKRVTYFPQLFLGLTFNIGVLIAWATLRGTVSWPPILIYVAAAIWTLGYDTIYSYQDIKDDIKLNLKSTAIKFKERGPTLIWSFYQITVALICIAGLHMHLNFFFYIGMAIAAYHLYWQIENLDILNENDCGKKFKSNVGFAFLVFAAILIGRI
ncbi:MAG: 4-hydroxybenzoate octaprenyltransferase [Candidatus Midichloria mitochondrii]|uniref:4-hydroxybenzoate octaprenyltransferase n=1 Tax=Midichloria mitochondrii (strain IricVA) TaxID=696127 RepID=F7XUT9_MIDMI|nr:4-hydroxybenzoate octaprenyltransferase [Candidatus Midichloria mitochondrii]AEI88438.1 4-hydroxybenzoate polyprenyltransferase-like prenyltransferase [Candidatus Midichloria mitochondrii IricVA]MDJ1287868.1 4-hydroxybenzoate octaprenyltransferase [Candidatus Midichloria mitochondrii]MDJ1298756.1 4-hydroxybenzoate octaprenyltransferase [Candidatus Midichloria mitochondrii]MDJ1312910.1 4-hydroxybenzoate octaprenyltransferase [Candidatus Midichloria mitochondrii]MDJ1583479.1 4-hydroxybenzoate